MGYRLAAAVVCLLVTGTVSAAAESRLVGVDDDGERAYVIRRGGGWSLETVDVESGRVIERWSATADNARALNDIHALIRFSPVDGTLEGDLVRLGDLVARTRPAVRAHWVNGQRTAAGYVYLNDSTIELADRTGAHVATLGEGNQPRPSPDGTRVVWTDDRARLVVAPARKGARPRTATPRHYFRGVQWSVDGKAILALSHDDGCIYRIPATTLRGKKLYCGGGDSLAGFAQDPTGRTLAAGARSSQSAPPSVTWLDAASGRVRARHELDGSLSYDAADQSLGPGGLFIALDETGGLVAVDLATGAKRERIGDHEGVRATRWKGSTVVLLRDFRDVVRVDVRALLAADAGARPDDE